MKKVYFIVGPTASGKTTLAPKVAKLLGVPWVSLDGLYDLMAKKIGLLSARQLVDPRVWQYSINFGLKEWGEYGDNYGVKREYIPEFLGKVGGDLIVEGYTASFAKERALITDYLGAEGVVLYLDFPYKVWSERCLKKHGHCPPPEEGYKALINSYEPTGITYRFTNESQILVDNGIYQREGFTDKKIERLRIGNVKCLSVLDMGCNAGWIGKYCLDKGAKSVTGIDRNWRYCEASRDLGMSVECCELDDWKPKRYDVILCISTFHYVKDPKSLLTKIANSCDRFILEIPVNQKGVDVEFIESNPHFRYSNDYMLSLLRKRFLSVELVGESVPPDDSYRLVYECKHTSH